MKLLAIGWLLAAQQGDAGLIDRATDAWLALAPQVAALEDARAALELADTARAVAALATVAWVDPAAAGSDRSVVRLDPRERPGTLDALLLLQWIGRSSAQNEADRIWRREADLTRAASEAGSDIAADAVYVARWLEDGAPLAPAADSRAFARVARLHRTAADSRDSVLVRWARLVLAHWDLAWLDAQLVWLTPETDDLWACRQQRGWCLARDVAPPGGGLNRWVAADSTAGPVLRRLRTDLRDAADGAWPLSELALRTWVGMEVALGSMPAMLLVEERVRAADLPERTRAELQVVLAETSRRPLRADSMMQAHPRWFAHLDTLVRMYPEAGLPPAPLWLAAWPFYLESFNGRRVAHRSRLVLADILDRLIPERGEFGLFESRAGVVRRGIPAAVYRLRRAEPDSGGRPGGGGRFDVVEIVDPAMHETILPLGRRVDELPTLDLALAARNAARGLTLSGFRAAAYDGMKDLDHQLVRVVRDGRSWLEFYAARPDVCREPRPVFGFFLLDPMFRVLRKHVDSAAVRTHRYRVRIPADSGVYLYSLELLDPGCRWAARARYLTGVPAMRDVDISDVVLADSLQMHDVRRVNGRMLVTPRYGLSVPAGGPVHFYWELYGVRATPGPDSRLTVTVQIVDVHRQPVHVLRLGDIARGARGRPTLGTEYSVGVPAGEGALGMTVSLELPSEAEGIYVARVSVTDERDARTLVAERGFRVLPSR